MKTVHERALTALLWAMLFFLTACSKDKSPGPEPEPAPDETASKPRHLIREIDWESFEYKAAVHYRPDSSIDHIRYSGSRGQTELKTYEYEGKTLSGINVAGSISRKFYEFDEKGRLTAMRLVKKNAGPYDNAQKLVFLYDDHGIVQKLERYQITPAGTRMDIVHHYEYDKAGELTRVRTEQSDGYQTITSLKGFSPGFDHDPWLFIEDFGNPDYAIYNLPVLRAMKGRLPLQITYEIPDKNGAFKTERITTQQFQVEGKKIQKLKTTVRYPEFPQAGDESEVSFKY
ncbi:hypothetical protein SAMN05216327_113164 [Dyadobacter sp. SG02]|uniref:hypothetical protein n=1 Tax=Dyadobacter sp. SG02 TaxID=1855291 RepID=UPI0008CBF54E|nr:hypothetical protein [Dyadobacter sp. SG02]SEJ59612.1 hypothetical protein SAMN05216327_113164 [Dyadobacter sp. SG02]